MSSGSVCKLDKRSIYIIPFEFMSPTRVNDENATNAKVINIPRKFLPPSLF